MKSAARSTVVGGQSRMKIRRLRRHDERGRQRRPLGDMRDEIAPGLAVLRRHLRPALGVLQKILFFLRAQAGKFRERMDALQALRRRQFSKRLQRFFHLLLLGIRQGVERFLFFHRRQLKKLVELGGDFLPLILRKRIPVRQIGIMRAMMPSAARRHERHRRTAC